MALRKLAKDGDSGKNGCPTVYLDDEGMLVIQGDLAPAALHDQLENVLPGEGAVRITPATVIAAVARLQQGV